jgi:hypothetical protein
MDKIAIEMVACLLIRVSSSSPRPPTVRLRLPSGKPQEANRIPTDRSMPHFETIESQMLARPDIADRPLQHVIDDQFGPSPG